MRFKLSLWVPDSASAEVQQEHTRLWMGRQKILKWVAVVTTIGLSITTLVLFMGVPAGTESISDLNGNFLLATLIAFITAVVFEKWEKDLDQEMFRLERSKEARHRIQDASEHG